MKYGLLAGGRHALIAVLETTKQVVGKDRPAVADALIQQIIERVQR